MRLKGIAIAMGVVVAVFAAFVVIALVASSNRGDSPVAEDGQGFGPPAIPAVFLSAYTSAQTRNAAANPTCKGLTWNLLAGIGAVESDQGSGRTISAAGEVTPKIIGPALDGTGVGGNTTPYYDTDGGAMDGDTKFDRAVGPMQFLPETWQSWGQDGNDDGIKDPHNIFDAALTAAAYLCGNDAVDLTDSTALDAAIYRYNRSSEYAADVRLYAQAYLTSG